MITKKGRKNDQHEQIKIDEGSNGGSSGGSYGETHRPVKVKETHLLILALIFLVVIILMALLNTHIGAVLVVGGILGVLIYKLYARP